MLLSEPPECWNYRPVPPCLAHNLFLKTSFLYYFETFIHVWVGGRVWYVHLSLPADVLELGSAGCEPPDRTWVPFPNLEPLCKRTCNFTCWAISSPDSFYKWTNWAIWLKKQPLKSNLNSYPEFPCSSPVPFLERTYTLNGKLLNLENNPSWNKWCVTWLILIILYVSALSFLFACVWHMEDGWKLMSGVFDSSFK